MKRSRHVALVLLGSAAAISGCDEQQQARENAIFQSLAECERFYDEGTCRTKAREAELQHAATAPKHQSKEACEAAFGPEACVAAPPPGQSEARDGSSGWFMPAMMGFMLGNALSRPMPLYQGTPAPGTPPGRQALYSGNSYVGATDTAANRRWNANAPAATGSRAALSVPASSRGGFGSTGRAYSGGGS